MALSKTLDLGNGVVVTDAYIYLNYFEKQRADQSVHVQLHAYASKDMREAKKPLGPVFDRTFSADDWAAIGGASGTTEALLYAAIKAKAQAIADEYAADAAFVAEHGLSGGYGIPERSIGRLAGATDV